MTVLEIDAAAYHRDEVSDSPALSASIAKLLITRSPAHARHAHPKLNPNYRERKTEEKYEMGTAVHAMLLEGRNAVLVVDAADWRTNDAKALRDHARETGLVPLLKDQWEEVQPMFESIVAQLATHKARPTPFTAGKPEQTLVWEEDGVTLKARIDWLHDDRSAIDDFKSTKASAEEKAWTRTMLGFGGDVQASFYLRACRAYGWDPVYRWVVVELEPPFALNVFTPDAAMLAIADDKVDTAIRRWRECLRTGVWPAYSGEVRRLEPLPWSEASWLEQRDAA